LRGQWRPFTAFPVARRSWFSIVPVRIVYRRDAWPTRDRMSINQNFYFENFLQYLRLKNLLRRSRNEGSSLFHQQNVVGKLRREIDVVCDDER
jgi:hypothetical protein